MEKELKRESFYRFYAETYRNLLFYVSRMEDVREQAEDIVQDVYSLAYQNWDELSKHENMIGWLYVTANNLVRNLRRLKERGNIPLDVWRTVSERSDGQDAISAIELQVAMKAMLSEKEEVVYEKKVEGYSTAEMAEELGISKGTVRRRVNNLRKKLKGMLEE